MAYSTMPVVYQDGVSWLSDSLPTIERLKDLKLLAERSYTGKQRNEILTIIREERDDQERETRCHQI